MTLPLYKGNTAPASLPASAHTGLWFDKFFNQWPANEWSLNPVADRNPKLDWIRPMAGKPSGNAKLLAEHADRMTSLARARGGTVLYLKTLSRFVTGLGREHPIENGFVWHPALGEPFLPGSSVKGLVRAWAATWLEIDKDAISRIFGPRDLRETPANIGSVVFFDALPAKPVQLSADVMTPHYGPYYEDGEAPGDWHNPVPIPFLTVAPGQSFVFALAPRTGSESDCADCSTAADWLATALFELGAGAKTAVGYGRFAASNIHEQALPSTGGSQRVSVPQTPNVHPLLKQVRTVPAEKLPSQRDQIIRDIEACPDAETRRACARDIRERYDKKKWREAAGKTWRESLEKLAE